MSQVVSFAVSRSPVVPGEVLVQAEDPKDIAASVKKRELRGVFSILDLLRGIWVTFDTEKLRSRSGEGARSPAHAVRP